MNSNEIEKEAHKIVMTTTLYGSPKAEIGSSARSYYETELRCVILGIEKQKENSLSDMQYYMEYCKNHDYVTPQEWILNHKHY